MREDETPHIEVFATQKFFFGSYTTRGGADSWPGSKNVRTVEKQVQVHSLLIAYMNAKTVGSYFVPTVVRTGAVLIVVVKTKRKLAH